MALSVIIALYLGIGLMSAALGSRVPIVLLLGYVLHGLWDLLHELQVHAGVGFDTRTVTEIPLAYGAFCATYDWAMAAHFYTRRRQYSAAWGAP